ncbi:Sensor protein [Gammaproteobacteria bacterium]
MKKEINKKNRAITSNNIDSYLEDYLREITACIPGNFYWKNKENRYLGCNQRLCETLGLRNEDIIGKTDHDLWPEQAEELHKNDAAVMASGQATNFEEIVHLKGQKPKFYAVIKIPLKDTNGNIIGIIGNSLDITYRKEAEQLEIEASHLRLENELQRIKIQEQERFALIASRVAHDIRSPLTTLQTIVMSTSKSLPEKNRVALNSVTKSITDVANNLLNRYKKATNETTTGVVEIQSILVSLTLSKIASEKRHQYANYPVKINDLYRPNSNFVFIKTDPSNFDRMISNLVNNSVDAFEGKKGKVDLKLSTENEQAKITIQDNGKGMPQKVIDKIMNNIAVTHSKKDGNGIGFTQIRSTLQLSKSSMLIESKIGKGTKIALTFPIADVPDWIAQQIILHKGDTVVVLDDDPSIHYAWNARFENYKGIVSLKHFKSGEKAIDFINAKPEKNKVFLLSDFELINQELNGLEVIERVSMRKQSVLVTSHYSNIKIHDLAAEIGVKILPKQLASEVPIKIKEKERNIDIFKKIDLVIIDDDQLLADSLANLLKDRFTGVEAYYHPKHFLENLSQYAKNTIICMDHDFKSQMNGIDLAEQLHEAGYTKLYLFSGKTFEKKEIPDYLTVLLKGDVNAFMQLKVDE